MFYERLLKIALSMKYWFYVLFLNNDYFKKNKIIKFLMILFFHCLRED